MALCIGQLTALVFEQVLENSPVPQGHFLHFALTGKPQPCYRARLDEQKYNWKGRPISRIQIVRNNLAMLGRRKLDPRRLR